MNAREGEKIEIVGEERAGQGLLQCQKCRTGRTRRLLSDRGPAPPPPSLPIAPSPLSPLSTPSLIPGQPSPSCTTWKGKEYNTYTLFLPHVYILYIYIPPKLNLKPADVQPTQQVCVHTTKHCRCDDHRTSFFTLSGVTITDHATCDVTTRSMRL